MIGQMLFFLSTVFFGSILLLCYDVIRGFRRVWIHNGWLVMLEDLVFWFLTGVACFRFLCWYNQGQLRGFFFLGFGIGMLVYYWKVSKYVVKFFSIFFKKIKGGMQWGFQKITAPFSHIMVRIRWKWKREKNDMKMVLKRTDKRGGQHEKKKKN